MFKSEAKLFLSANNKVNSAKILINECKRLIVDFNLEGNSDCNSLKSNINNCNINSLVTKVEDTKESLMKLDQEFAREYLNLLQEYLQTSTIDTSNMTEEEKMEYAIKMDAYDRDYNQTLLYMLEKYEESGMLTDEMKQQLQYQREIMAQYDIKDQMAVLSPATDEYINLFKQCAESDKRLINLNPSLSEEEKASYLKEYDIQYNKNLDALINARDARLKREKDEKELEELYASKSDNNGFFHPFVEGEIDEAILDKRISMGIATDDEIAYKNMNDWDRFLTDTGTFAASTFTGLYNITEGIGDGFVMIGSVVNIVDRDWASEYISRDLSAELYQGIQLSNNMNTYSAYGTWHEVGETVGGFVGKAGITFAAPWASATLYGLDAMGQSAEVSFNNGDDYWSAVGKSFVSGVGGAAEGYAFGKLNMGVRNFVSSGTLKTVGGTTWTGIKNLGSTITSPGGLKTVGSNLWNITKSGVKQVPSFLGKAGLTTLKDADALIETGCVIANNCIEFGTTGDWDYEKLLKEAGTVFAINYFMNFASSLVFDVNIKPDTKLNSYQKLNDFYNKMSLDGLSDDKALNLFYETFYRSIENGNMDAEDILNKLDILKNEHPVLNIISSNTPSSYYSSSDHSIVINLKTISSNDYGTVAHELGHCLFDMNLDGVLPENWDDIVARARVNSSKGNGLDKVIYTYNNANYVSKVEGDLIYREVINSRFNIDMKKYQEVLTDQYVNLLDDFDPSNNKLENILRTQGFDDNKIKNILENIDSVSASDLAITQMNIERGFYADIYYRQNFRDEAAMSDITSAIFEGSDVGLYNKNLKSTYKHGMEYYQKGPKNLPFHEMIANYTQIKLTGNKNSIKLLRDAFGDEYINTLEEVFQKFKQ